MRDRFLEIKQLIDAARRVLLPFHISPDGDMVGSSLALGAYLKKLGKEVKVASADPVDSSWSFLPHFELIDNIDPVELELSDYDLIIFTDCENVQRVSKEERFKVPSSVVTVSIDHHASNKQRCSINVVDAESVSSTAQLVLRFFETIGFAVEQDMATLLYWGLVTDTGLFEYGQNLIRAHEDAAKLLSLGVSHDELLVRLKGNQSIGSLKFVAKALSNIQVDKEYGFCWITLSYPEIEKFSVEDRAYYAVKPFLKVLRGAEFGFLLREDEPELVRGSFRSRRKGVFDVSQVAKVLGGGGHPRAAGFTLRMPLVESEELVLKTVREFVRKK